MIMKKLYQALPILRKTLELSIIENIDNCVVHVYRFGLLAHQSKFLSYSYL